jgi:hypothetical protein
MDVLDLDRPEEATASSVGDSIARLVVWPIMLSGPNGELADIDLLHTRRDKIEELMLWSLHLSNHSVHVSEIAVDWNSRCAAGTSPLTATTARGCELPDGDWRVRALRALAGEAIMAACD